LFLCDEPGNGIQSVTDELFAESIRFNERPAAANEWIEKST
jgi:hypothetical protein